MIVYKLKQQEAFCWLVASLKELKTLIIQRVAAGFAHNEFRLWGVSPRPKVRSTSKCFQQRLICVTTKRFNLLQHKTNATSSRKLVLLTKMEKIPFSWLFPLPGETILVLGETRYNGSRTGYCSCPCLCLCFCCQWKPGFCSYLYLEHTTSTKNVKNNSKLQQFQLIIVLAKLWNWKFTVWN